MKLGLPIAATDWRTGAARLGPTLVEVVEAAVPNLRRIVLLPRCDHWTQQERPPT